MMSRQALAPLTRVDLKAEPETGTKRRSLAGQPEGMTAAEIRQLRLCLEWTQRRLAVVVGAHRSTISRWECGRQRPGWSRARRLALLVQANEKAKRDRAVRGDSAATHTRRTLADEERRALIARLEGRRVIASISGGKDSAAMSLYLHELGIEHERVFIDTGWEAPATYEYLREVLPKTLGPITWLRAERQMEELIQHKGMFPSRLVRFCTRDLKIRPISQYLRSLMDQGHDVINAVGIRAAESAARAHLPEFEWQDGYDCEVWRPLLRWTEQDVIEIHRRHGLRPNPLYLLGAARVGCWPCIHARKSEIRLIAETDPARIVRLRVLEEEVGVTAERRAARDGRQLHSSPAWFQNPTSRPGPDGKRDGACWPIERVVQWSRTALRGPQQDRDEFLFSGQLDGCMRWGLCETSPELDHGRETQPEESQAG